MQELETKYLLTAGEDPERALRRLLQDLAWAGYQIHPETTRLLQDVYYDTPDERLRHAGWSLRCRHRSLAVELTCKQLANVDGRLFERREVVQTTLHERPDLESLEDGPVRELLLRYLPRDTVLNPVFSQENHRQLYTIRHPDTPRARVELAMDHVRLESPKPLEYVEFEGELRQGPTEFLESFSRVLAAHPALTRSRVSKFHRGRFNANPLNAGPANHVSLLAPTDTWSRLLATYLNQQFQALTFYEPFAYEGIHPEGVHQMRVAIRRLRAALKACDEGLPLDEHDLLADEARWLGRVLGRVRDQDVHLQQLAAYRKRIPASRHDTLAEYEAHLLENRHRARCGLLASLDGRRYEKFLSRFQTLLAEAETLTRTGPSVRTVARSLVPPGLRDVRKAGRRIKPRSRPKRYHRLRIRIKRLRYTLEMLGGPYGDKLRRSTRALRKLQSDLGQHQDACVAAAELARFRDSHPTGNRARRTFDRLIRFERRRAAQLRDRFPKRWRRFEKEAKALARLF